jgi:hypothetical protein
MPKGPYTTSNTTPPWPMTAIGSAPSVTDKYPITNIAWTEVRVFRDYPSEIKSSYGQNNLSHTYFQEVCLLTYFQEVCLLNGEKFVARLENTRLKQDRKLNDVQLSMGHTYDPWYRSISSHQRTHYNHLYLDNRHTSEVEFQLSVGANHQTSMLIWGFSSTIDRQPISLILYTIAELEYVNAKKKDAHLKFIHPYMCNISEDYNLRHTP